MNDSEATLDVSPVMSYAIFDIETVIISSCKNNERKTNRLHWEKPTDAMLHITDCIRKENVRVMESNPINDNFRLRLHLNEVEVSQGNQIICSYCFIIDMPTNLDFYSVATPGLFISAKFTLEFETDEKLPKFSGDVTIFVDATAVSEKILQYFLDR